jgi:hypothetical protein
MIVFLDSPIWSQYIITYSVSDLAVKAAAPRPAPVSPHTSRSPERRSAPAAEQHDDNGKQCCGGTATLQFGPLIVLKKADNNTPLLFRHHMLTEAFLDISVVLTSPDGLAFTHYDLVQVSVNDTVGGTDSAYCWDVSQNTPC